MSNVLVSVAELSEKITINGKPLTARGIDLLDGVALLQRFPQLAAVFGAGASKLSPVEIAGLGKPLLGALIAAGIGAAGDEPTETAAAGMGMGNQVKLLLPILRFTLPDGAGPFVEQLVGLAGAVNPAGTDAPAAGGKPMRFRAKRSPRRSSS